MPPPSRAEQAKRREAFKSITAIKSDKEADQFLEACSWAVEGAVELFFTRESEDPGTRKRKEPTSPIEIIADWRSKASELRIDTNEPLLSLITRGFDAMDVLLSPSSNIDEIDLCLKNLRDEQKIREIYGVDEPGQLSDLLHGLARTSFLSFSRLMNSIDSRVELPEAALDSAKVWWRKTAHHSLTHSTDPLLSLITKALETTAAILEDSWSVKKVKCALSLLDAAIHNYRLADRETVEPSRELMFGYIQCLPLTLSVLVEKREKSKEETKVSIDERASEAVDEATTVEGVVTREEVRVPAAVSEEKKNDGTASTEGEGPAKGVEEEKSKTAIHEGEKSAERTEGQIDGKDAAAATLAASAADALADENESTPIDTLADRFDGEGKIAATQGDYNELEERPVEREEPLEEAKKDAVADENEVAPVDEASLQVRSAEETIPVEGADATAAAAAAPAAVDDDDEHLGSQEEDNLSTMSLAGSTDDDSDWDQVESISVVKKNKEGPPGKETVKKEEPPSRPATQEDQRGQLNGANVGADAVNGVGEGNDGEVAEEVKEEIKEEPLSQPGSQDEEYQRLLQNGAHVPGAVDPSLFAHGDRDDEQGQGGEEVKEEPRSAAASQDDQRRDHRLRVEEMAEEGAQGARLGSQSLMKCSRCGWWTGEGADTFIGHLLQEHDTTLEGEGLWLRCDCGDYTQSVDHSISGTCGFAQSALKTRAEKDAEQALYEIVPNAGGSMKIRLKCSRCEWTTIDGALSYVAHLKDDHGTDPEKERLWLICNCGHPARTLGHFAFSDKCNVMLATVIRDDALEALGYDVQVAKPPKVAVKRAATVRGEEGAVKKHKAEKKSASFSKKKSSRGQKDPKVSRSVTKS